jgi:hypothetical protein
VEGPGATTVAVQVEVATVDDASVAWINIEWVPGETRAVRVGVVLPFPHKNATGATPFVEEAVHVILVVEGAPTHETENEAALATLEESRNATLAIEAMTLLDFIVEFVYVLTDTALLVMTLRTGHAVTDAPEWVFLQGSLW